MVWYAAPLLHRRIKIQSCGVEFDHSKISCVYNVQLQYSVHVVHVMLWC